MTKRRLSWIALVLVLASLPLFMGAYEDTIQRWFFQMNPLINKADPSIVFDTQNATDTDFWIGVQEDSNGVDDDTFQIGDGSTPGTNGLISIDTDGYLSTLIAERGISLASQGDPFNMFIDSVTINDVRDDMFIFGWNIAKGSYNTKYDESKPMLRFHIENDCYTDNNIHQFEVIIDYKDANDTVYSRPLQIFPKYTNEILWGLQGNYFYFMPPVSDGTFGEQSNPALFIDTNGSNNCVMIGDVSNVDCPNGLTINALATGDNLCFKKTGISNPVTSDTTETDTFARFNTTSGANGGLQISGYTDTSVNGAIWLKAVLGVADPTDTHAAFVLQGNKLSGTARTALGNDETVLHVYNYSSILLTLLGDGDFGIQTQTPGGALDISPGSSGGLYFEAAEATTSITANHTITIQTNVPSGSKLLGCQLRVDTALATGETWNAAYVTGATQSIAAAAAVTQNTKVNTFFDEHAATAIASGEVDIAIQRNSNPGVDSFTAQGSIRAIVYYQGFTAMGNAS